MIIPTHNKVVFFFVLLISLSISKLKAQTQPNDTLKKVSADTLKVDDDSESLEEKVTYSAQDSIVALPQEGRALLYGKAKVNYGSIDMQAELIEINYTKNLIIAKGKRDSLGKPYGNPMFKDGGETMEADTIIYNLKSKKGKIYNALTKQGELLVVGNEIKKDSLNNVYFKNMRCIPCQEADARTVFRANKAKAIPDDKIITGPMYLEIGGVPTPLGLPFGYFPNTKKQANGILIPTFGYDERSMGFSLQQGGFYWGISEQTDMITRGSIYGNGSWMLSANNNYNILYKSTGKTLLKYSSFNEGDPDIPKTYKRRTAYEVNWLHTQDNKSNPTVRFNANVNFRNNQLVNRFNAINSGEYLQNVFQSNIGYSKTFKMSSLSINARHEQVSQTNAMEITFPQLTYNVNRFFPFKRETAVKQNIFDKLGISYLLEAQNTLRGRDTTIFKGSPLDSLNYGIRHSIPISTNFNILKYITATPGLNLSSVMYTKSIRKDFFDERYSRTYQLNDSVDVTRDSVARGVRTRNVKEFAAGYSAEFTTAFNTKLYFDYFYRKGKIKQIRHVMIPTVTYGYRPDFGAEQYGFWKKVQRDTAGNLQNYSIFERGVYGGPDIGKRNAISVNLNNNIEAKLKQRTDTGLGFKKVVLIQGLGLGGSYNFAADSFKLSGLNISLRTILFKYFDINANSGFDPYVYDQVSGRTIDQYTFSKDGRLARFTTASFAVATSIGSNMLQAMRKARQAPDMTNGAERGAVTDLNPQESLPWNLRLNYQLSLNNPNDRKLQPSHTLNFSGDLMPTKFWKLGISSGFDFNTQKLSYTSFNIYRDLKCWEARVDWIPFGPRKSYRLTLNLKTSMLSDFKIPKQSLPRIENY